MKAKEFLQNNPEINKILKEWFFEKLIESLKNFNHSEEFKEFILKKGISDEQIVTVIDENPRVCFDILDKNDIIILIDYDKTLGWTSNYHSDKDEKYCKDRLSCEKESLFIALEELKNKIVTKTD